MVHKRSMGVSSERAVYAVPLQEVGDGRQEHAGDDLAVRYHDVGAHAGVQCELGEDVEPRERDLDCNHD